MSICGFTGRDGPSYWGWLLDSVLLCYLEGLLLGILAQLYEVWVSS